MEFDRNNPSFPVLPSIMSSFTRKAQARSTAVSAQAPLGVSMKDVAGQQLTRYANVGYGQ
jgi:hypothetical protein